MCAQVSMDYDAWMVACQTTMLDASLLESLVLRSVFKVATIVIIVLSSHLLQPASD